MLQEQIQAILFVASKPISQKKLAKVLEVTIDEVADALAQLQERYAGNSGIKIVQSEQDVQMTTNEMYSEYVEQFTKSEVMGELTRAQLETLTVVAYKQPITRPELEQIRGVNCAVILRNLMQRGLVEEEDSKDQIMPTYRLSITALRHLGVSSVDELPDYASFSEHEHIEHALEK